jgi:hypothetical protein
MIHIKYAPLFDIGFLHDYYTDKQCRDIMVVPSPACAQLLTRLGLRSVATDTGCQVWAKVTRVGNKDFVVADIPENTRFTFLLLLQNPHFETFSSLNLGKNADQHYYFNNLVNNAAGDIAHLVADTGTKKAGNNDLLKFVRNTYQFSHPNNAATRTGEIRYTDSGEKLENTLDNNNDLFNFSFDLRDTSGGRAGFFIENANTDNFYVHDASARQDVFGVIEVFHRAALPAAYRFIDNDKSVSEKKYRIQFANRQTTWRYVINKKFNQQVTDVKIKKTGTGSIDFTKKAGTPAGQFILSSDTAVPLKQEAVTGIRMTDQNDKEIIAHLPNASTQLLKQEGAQFFSEILITI